MWMIIIASALGMAGCSSSGKQVKPASTAAAQTSGKNQSHRQIHRVSGIPGQRKKSRAFASAIRSGQSFGSRSRTSENGRELANHRGQARRSASGHVLGEGTFSRTGGVEAAYCRRSHQAAHLRIARLAVLKGGLRPHRTEVAAVNFSRGTSVILDKGLRWSVPTCPTACGRIDPASNGDTRGVRNLREWPATCTRAGVGVSVQPCLAGSSFFVSD